MRQPVAETTGSGHPQIIWRNRQIICGCPEPVVSATGWRIIFNPFI